MRLLKFLSEDTQSRDYIIKTLLKDCSNYLNLLGIKEFNKNMIKFYRNDGRHSGNITKLDVSQNRQPVRTYRHFSGPINEWLISNGHVPRNKCVSATSSKDNSSIFTGKNPGLIFPIGSFDYTFVKAEDFNYDKFDKRNMGGNGWDTCALVWLIKEKLFNLDTKVVWIQKDSKSYISNEKVLKFLKEQNVDKIPILCKSISAGIEGVDIFAEWEKRAKNVKNLFVSNKSVEEAYKYNYEIWFNCKSYYLVDEKALF